MKKYLIFTAFLVFILSFTTSVHAAWYNQDYSNKVLINVTERSGIAGLMNYSVRLNITYDSDMQVDFDDLLFTNASETANLSYWTEKHYNSNHAIVWVRVDNLTVNANTTIYLYYGNITASNFSNLSQTFLVWDNFDAIDTGKWNLTENNAGGATCSITNSALNCSGASGTQYHFSYIQSNMSHISLLFRGLLFYV